MLEHTRVRAMHIQTAEGDVRQMTEVDSVSIFENSFFASRSLGYGILGWTATQVHKKMVLRQLHTMFQIVRQCVRLVHEFSNKRLLKIWIELALIDAPRAK